MRLTGNTLKPQLMFASLITIAVALFLYVDSSGAGATGQPPRYAGYAGHGYAAQHGRRNCRDGGEAGSRQKGKRVQPPSGRVAGGAGGAFLSTQDKFAKRWPAVRYVWPCCFLAAGIFLAVFSDTEIWPFGNQSLWFAITHNSEDLEHKTFAVILLALGTIELLRARGRLHSLWSKWAFPVVGMIGAVMLLFHHHTAGMHGAHHMETMEHIQNQHRAFAAAGGGIALTKGLSEVHTTWQQVFQKMWPTLLIVLGVLLMMYTE